MRRRKKREKRKRKKRKSRREYREAITLVLERNSTVGFRDYLRIQRGWKRRGVRWIRKGGRVDNNSERYGYEDGRK